MSVPVGGSERDAVSDPGPSAGGWTTDEMMSVAAARSLRGARTCFVGIGLPSIAANLARHVHEPGLVLIYESGTIGAKPDVLPLSIGDGELADTADSVVSVPEIFAYWLQGGRCDVGFLSAAQLDRFANINTTAVSRRGDRTGEGKTDSGGDRPEVRLPGAGGAPEIGAHAGTVLITVRHTPRVFVDRLDFVTTMGHGSGGDDRAKLGLRGAGPSRVITDLGVLEPDPDSRELVLVAVHPGVEVGRVREQTGWPLLVADQVDTSPPPTAEELRVLRDLHARTEEAHRAGA